MNTAKFHIHVTSKKQNKQKQTDSQVQNKMVVARGEGHDRMGEMGEIGERN